MNARSKVLAVVASVALLVLGAAPAAAVDATIRVFEGAVRAAAEPDAPVLELLPQGTKVSVDEQVENGWRRIRLMDGKSIGWILDSAVALTPVAPEPPPTILRSPPPAPLVVRAPTRVSSLSMLVEETSADPVVHAKAKELDADDDTAIVVIVVSGIVGLGLIMSSLAAFPDDDVDDLDYDPDYTLSYALLTSGAAVGGLGALVGLAMQPGDDDMNRVVNLWNERNPAEPIEWSVKPVTMIYMPGLYK